jgi:hypothetical protein
MQDFGSGDGGSNPPGGMGFCRAKQPEGSFSPIVERGYRERERTSRRVFSKKRVLRPHRKEPYRPDDYFQRFYQAIRDPDQNDMISGMGETTFTGRGCLWRFIPAFFTPLAL